MGQHKISANEQSHEVEKAYKLVKQGKSLEARQIYLNLIKEGYVNEEIYNELSNLYGREGDFEKASLVAKEAIKLNPLNSISYQILGKAYACFHSSKYDKALSSFSKAIELDPINPFNYFNQGNLLAKIGKDNQAIESFNQAIALKNDFIEAHQSISLLLLKRGDYSHGLKEYEYRFLGKDKYRLLNASEPLIPIWKNEAINSIGKLLLVSEQGIGDTLHFMRYIIILKKYMSSVSLCTTLNLHGIIKSSGILSDPIAPEKSQEINEGMWLPLMSLAHRLHVSPDNPLITEPYIKTSEEFSAKWKSILSGEKRPLIGINWQGGIDSEIANLIGRSIPLQQLSPIVLSSKASFISLQKGFGIEQLETCTFKDHFVKCQNIANESIELLETAAIIENCDLVITSDTAVAHLAGGMGISTFLLLHKFNDWRWGSNDNKTFWYPAIKIFRQSQNGDWSYPILEIARELELYPL